jgi:LysM repeat protein
MRVKLATVSGPSIWVAVLAALLWLGLTAPAWADVIYIVGEGDSAWSIAVHFGITLDELYLANGWAIDQDPILQIGQCVNIPAPSEADENDQSAAESGVQPQTYTVREGDNPFLISHQFNVSVLSLLEYNQLTENDLISVGQTLKIPPSDYVYQGNAESTGTPVDPATQPEPLKYTVVEGDNAWSIARRFGITVQGLLSFNNLSDSSLLHIGDELKIPPTENQSEPDSRLLELTHVVQTGETLDSIATAYGVSAESIVEANGLAADSQLSAGQPLRIPARRDIPSEGGIEDLSGELQPLPELGNSGAWRSEIFDFGQIAPPQPSTPDLNQEASRSQWSVDGYFEDGRPYHKYTIRRGDTVSAVAHAFNVTQSELMNRNGLDSRSMLRIGRDLKIPLDLPSAPSPRSSRGLPRTHHSIHVGAPDGGIGSSEGTASGRSVVEEAMKHLGMPYVWSGCSLTGGADCSGFTSAVYSLFGISLPHSAREQAGSGVAVDYSDLQPGDLVLFHTTRSGISHVGIYIGGGEFVHSSSARGGVVVSPLDSGYYRSRFVCARRVL